MARDRAGRVDRAWVMAGDVYGNGMGIGPCGFVVRPRMVIGLGLWLGRESNVGDDA